MITGKMNYKGLSACQKIFTDYFFAEVICSCYLVSNIYRKNYFPNILLHYHFLLLVTF